MSRSVDLRPSEVAVRRARITEDLGTIDRTPIEDQLFDAPTITEVEFRETIGDARIPDRLPEQGNVAEVAAILGLHARQSVYGIDLPYELIDGHRVYDLDAVKAYAAKNQIPAGYARLAEVATAAGVAPQTIAKWSRMGDVRSVVVSGGRVYRIADAIARAAR